MEFYPLLKKMLTKEGFGRERIILTTNDLQATKDRHAISLRLNQEKGKELSRESIMHSKFSEFNKYVFAKNISFDLFVSIYEINLQECVAFRFFSPLSKKEKEAISAIVKKRGFRNCEVRIIGMQDNSLPLSSSFFLFEDFHFLLKEADLFGNEVRHIALDLKTGMTYNLLLENRIYRPGELKNLENFSDFQSNLPQRNFSNVEV
ncbi:MAG: hypothetical protein QXL16_01595 [Candidatus Micrarchaeaceae archaeon]